MKPIHSIALFRLAVLGPLASRSPSRGELQQTLRILAQKDYEIPGSTRTRVGVKTIEAWYYAWTKQGIDGLIPPTRPAAYPQPWRPGRATGRPVYYREKRLVRKDGTVAYLGQRFEVPFELTGQSVMLVVDPHQGQVLRVEDAE
jgi:hypothetical protein